MRCLLVALGLLFFPRMAAAERLTLAQALELGARRAPEIRAARANETSEEAQYRVAESAYYPTASASLQAQVQTQRTATPQLDPRNGNVLVPRIVTNTVQGAGAVNGQWTLYDFGRTAGLVANARGQLANATATVRATQLTVAGAVASAYVTVVAVEKQRAVAEQTLQHRESLVALAHGIVHAGLQPPLEEMRARARADGARRDLAQADGALVDARAALAALLALAPTASYQVEAPRLAVPAGPPDAAMREADRLPAVKLAYAIVDAKEGSLDAARAQYRPSLGLQSNGSYQLTYIDRVQSWAQAGTGNAILALTQTLFDPSIGPSIDAARANVANARAVADQALRDAREEAARSVLAARAAEAMRGEAANAAAGAASVLEVVTARYAQGLASPVELIEAETADTYARTLLAQDELSCALAVVRVYLATGRPFER